MIGPEAVVAGTADVSVVIRVMQNTAGGTNPGDPLTGLSASGIAMQYRRDGANASGSITDSDIALNASHTDGGFEEIGEGYYRFDLPDAACAVGVNGVLLFGTVTNATVYAPYIRLLDPVSNLFKSEILGSTGNDSTHIHVPGWTFANDEPNDELVHIFDTDQNEWHPAWITDWVASTKLATVVSARSGGALPFTPADASDRVARLGFTRSGLLNAASVSAVQSGLGTSANQSTLLGRVVGTIAAGTHVAQTGDSYARIGANGAGLTALAQAAKLVGTIAAGTHVAQTGDSFARIGATGSGLSSLAPASATTTLLARIVGTIATGTHNPQSGDSYARIGAAGAGLTAVALASLNSAALQQIVDDLENGGRLDLLIDAIKNKTDSLTFTGNSVQADIQAVDGDAISQGGSDPASPYGVT